MPLLRIMDAIKASVIRYKHNNVFKHNSKNIKKYQPLADLPRWCMRMKRTIKVIQLFLPVSGLPLLSLYLIFFVFRKALHHSTWVQGHKWSRITWFIIFILPDLSFFCLCHYNIIDAIDSKEYCVALFVFRLSLPRYCWRLCAFTEDGWCRLVF